MTGKEYFNNLNTIELNKEAVDKISELYTADLPELVLKIVSDKATPVFWDDDSRVLSIEEILDAEDDLHVSFANRGIIPLIDMGENDFIVYDYTNGHWSMFNIVDETVFNQKDTIEELVKS